MSQPAVHDPFETFVAELAGATDSDALRDRVAGTLKRLAGAAGVAFLERSGEAKYVCTFASVKSADSIDARGSLARWLRVNAEVLILRDRPDVLPYLSPEERGALEQIGCDACVPLVFDGSLLAVVLLSGTDDLEGLRRHSSLIAGFAARAAPPWHRVIRSEELNARHEALGRSHRLGVAGQLAASVAHEVRNPLAAIRSLVQFAKDTPVDAKERESILSDVLEEVDRIDQTVSAMLQLSQPSTADRRKVDLNDLVQSVFRFVRAYAQKRGLSIRVESTDADVQVAGDDRELRQVVTNLFLNACQACVEGGLVVGMVRNGPEARWAEVEIRDTGCGIPEDQLARVLDPFFTTKPQGTGLGLPYCRDVAERHGGSIAIRSTPGAGTAVIVRLPKSELNEPLSG